MPSSWDHRHRNRTATRKYVAARKVVNRLHRTTAVQLQYSWFLLDSDQFLLNLIDCKKAYLSADREQLILMVPKQKIVNFRGFFSGLHPFILNLYMVDT